jgi:hypothetical protein
MSPLCVRSAGGKEGGGAIKYRKAAIKVFLSSLLYYLAMSQPCSHFGPCSFRSVENAIYERNRRQDARVG